MIYTGTVKTLIYRGAQITLICAALSPVYRMKLAGDRVISKLNTVANWAIAVLLGAIAIASFGLRCNVLSALVAGDERLRPSYMARFNPLATQTRVSVQLDFAYTSIAFVAAVGALGWAVFTAAKASPTARTVSLMQLGQEPC